MSTDRRDARVRRYLSEPDSRDRWLVSTWYSDLMSQAIGARTHAGLTQKDIAERLGTTQSAIARLENDLDAKAGAGRLMRYLVACGVVPMADTVPFEVVMDGLMTDPSLPLQAASFADWDEDAPVAKEASSNVVLEPDPAEERVVPASGVESDLAVSALRNQAHLLATSSLYGPAGSLNRFFSDATKLSNTYAATVSRAVEGLADWNTRFIQQLAPVWSAFDATAGAVAARAVTQRVEGADLLGNTLVSDDEDESSPVPSFDRQTNKRVERPKNVLIFRKPAPPGADPTLFERGEQGLMIPQGPRVVAAS